jgi:hypothetical protein
MDFNYTLKYRTFDQLLEDVSIDLYTFSLENMIEPQQLIKVVKKINYDLGLRINQQTEAVLEVTHGKAKLPDDFYTFNYAMLCANYVVYRGYAPGGTNIVEVPYQEVPSTTNQCATPTVNCSVCNSNPCNQTAACAGHIPPTNYIPTEYDPNNPYGDTCIKPRVFVNCKGESYELVQVIKPNVTRVYRDLIPLKMKASQNIECDCPNLYFNTPNEAWIKDGYLFTSIEEGNVYINYQAHLQDDDGNLLVPDHDLLNDYYEYAVKKRILENLFMNGEDVASRLQLVNAELRVSRNAALSLVNTPNFAEMRQLWEANRKAQYGKFYYMFMGQSPNNYFYRNYNKIRVV